MKAIQQELGDDGEAEASKSCASGSRRSISAGGAYGSRPRAAAPRARPRESGGVAQVIRTYLETVADLPWSERTEDKSRPRLAEEILERDHYGLDDVKDRILEYLAVRKLQGARSDEEADAKEDGRRSRRSPREASGTVMASADEDDGNDGSDDANDADEVEEAQQRRPRDADDRRLDRSCSSAPRASARRPSPSRSPKR
jgi:ATP-dependent Lon protease